MISLIIGDARRSKHTIVNQNAGPDKISLYNGQSQRQLTTVLQSKPQYSQPQSKPVSVAAPQQTVTVKPVTSIINNYSPAQDIVKKVVTERSTTTTTAANNHFYSAQKKDDCKFNPKNTVSKLKFIQYLYLIFLILKNKLQNSYLFCEIKLLYFINFQNIFT